MNTEQKFNSWGEWIDFVSQPPAGGDMNSSKDGGYHFTRTETYEKALQLATNGWDDAEAAARKISNALVRRIGALVERDEEIFDVEGAAVDVGLMLQGIPEHMVRYEQHFTESPGPIVRIMFNISASCGISPETMIAKGAAVAGLVECIELSGKSVELWAVARCRESYHSVVTRVLVKAAGQPLDMGRVMFAVGHPSSLRRLWFRWLERQEKEVRFPFRFGYGIPNDLEEDSDRGDIYVGKSLFGEPQWTDEQQAIAWVIKTLRKQNINVNDHTVPVGSPEEE